MPATVAIPAWNVVVALVTNEHSLSRASAEVSRSAAVQRSQVVSQVKRGVNVTADRFDVELLPERSLTGCHVQRVFSFNVCSLIPDIVTDRGPFLLKHLVLIDACANASRNR